jgi:Tol biopolymer transport system component
VAIRLVTYSGHDTSPAVSPDGKTIAFTSDRGGQPRIWLKQLKGGGEMALTAGPDDFPRFSPDGTSVLFIHAQLGSTSLHRITLLGNDPHKVVDDAEQGDWSPDGKQIAFVSDRGGAHEIFVANPDGSGLVRLTDTPGSNSLPRWSPDGKTIAFISSRDGFDEIYLMEADGGHQTRLTSNPANQTCPHWPF